jgi:PAS domain S-box-containing protein
MDDDTELPAAPAQPGTDGSGAVLDGLIEAHGLLEATPECLVVAAVDGRIVFSNHRMQDLCGFSSEDLLDRPVGELVSAGSPIDEAGVGRPFEGTCHRKDGLEVPVEVHLGVVQGRGGRYLVVTLRDVSELARARPPGSRPRRSTSRSSRVSRRSRTSIRLMRTRAAST